MAHFVLFDSATGALVSEGGTEPGHTAAQTVRRYEERPQGAWDAASHDYVDREITPGLAIGLLRYIVDPADPLGLPVDVILATDPDPAPPLSAVALATLPGPDDEWNGAAFAPPTTLGDRATHALLVGGLPLVHQWRALRTLRGDDDIAAWPPELLAMLDVLVARALRKIYLTLRGQALLG